MQDNVLGVVKHRHADNGAASEGQIVEVGVQREVIAERTYVTRQPELCPWKQFSICGHRVDRLKGSSLVRLQTTRLQKDGGLR